MIGAIVGGITTLASEWFKGRREIKQAKVEAKKAKFEADAKFHMKMAEVEANWDIIALRQSSKSWADEFLIVVFILPLFLAWLPQLRPYTADWIVFLDGLPMYYWLILIGMVSAKFGLRWLFSSFSQKSLQNRFKN